VHNTTIILLNQFATMTADIHIENYIQGSRKYFFLEKKKFKKLLRNFFFFYYWKKKFYKMSWGANYCTAIFVCGGNFFEKCFPIFYFTTSIHLKSGLIRGIAFCGSGLIREVASLERDNLVIHFSILLSPFI
jgi:hypothetical protein